MPVEVRELSRVRPVDARSEGLALVVVAVVLGGRARARLGRVGDAHLHAHREMERDGARWGEMERDGGR